MRNARSAMRKMFVISLVVVMLVVTLGTGIAGAASTTGGSPGGRCVAIQSFPAIHCPGSLYAFTRVSGISPASTTSPISD